MSHALLILKIYTTFKDVQVMLKHFFDISTGFRNKKKWKRVLRPSIETSMHYRLSKFVSKANFLFYDVYNGLVFYLETKAISILAGNLNSGRSNLITAAFLKSISIFHTRPELYLPFPFVKTFK